MTTANSAFWEAVTLVAIVLVVLIASTAHVKGWIPGLSGATGTATDTGANGASGTGVPGADDAGVTRRKRRERTPADGVTDVPDTAPPEGPPTDSPTRPRRRRRSLTDSDTDDGNIIDNDIGYNTDGSGTTTPGTATTPAFVAPNDNTAEYERYQSEDEREREAERRFRESQGEPVKVVRRVCGPVVAPNGQNHDVGVFLRLDESATYIDQADEEHDGAESVEAQGVTVPPQHFGTYANSPRPPPFGGKDSSNTFGNKEPDGPRDGFSLGSAAPLGQASSGWPTDLPGGDHLRNPEVYMADKLPDNSAVHAEIENERKARELNELLFGPRPDGHGVGDLPPVVPSDPEGGSGVPVSPVKLHAGEKQPDPIDLELLPPLPSSPVKRVPPPLDLQKHLEKTASEAELSGDTAVPGSDDEAFAEAHNPKPDKGGDGEQALVLAGKKKQLGKIKAKEIELLEDVKPATKKEVLDAKADPKLLEAQAALEKLKAEKKKVKKEMKALEMALAQKQLEPAPKQLALENKAHVSASDEDTDVEVSSKVDKDEKKTKDKKDKEEAGDLDVAKKGKKKAKAKAGSETEVGKREKKKTKVVQDGGSSDSVNEETAIIKAEKGKMKELDGGKEGKTKAKKKTQEGTETASDSEGESEKEEKKKRKMKNKEKGEEETGLVRATRKEKKAKDAGDEKAKKKPKALKKEGESEEEEESESEDPETGQKKKKKVTAGSSEEVTEDAGSGKERKKGSRELEMVRDARTRRKELAAASEEELSEDGVTVRRKRRDGGGKKRQEMLKERREEYASDEGETQTTRQWQQGASRERGPTQESKRRLALTEAGEDPDERFGYPWETPEASTRRKVRVGPDRGGRPDEAELQRQEYNDRRDEEKGSGNRQGQQDIAASTGPRKAEKDEEAANPMQNISRKERLKAALGRENAAKAEAGDKTSAVELGNDGEEVSAADKKPDGEEKGSDKSDKVRKARGERKGNGEGQKEGDVPEPEVVQGKGKTGLVPQADDQPAHQIEEKKSSPVFLRATDKAWAASVRQNRNNRRTEDEEDVERNEETRSQEPIEARFANKGTAQSPPIETKRSPREKSRRRDSGPVGPDEIWEPPSPVKQTDSVRRNPLTLTEHGERTPDSKDAPQLVETSMVGPVDNRNSLEVFTEEYDRNESARVERVEKIRQNAMPKHEEASKSEDQVASSSEGPLRLEEAPKRTALDEQMDDIFNRRNARHKEREPVPVNAHSQSADPLSEYFDQPRLSPERTTEVRYHEQSDYRSPSPIPRSPVRERSPIVDDTPRGRAQDYERQISPALERSQPMKTRKSSLEEEEVLSFRTAPKRVDGVDEAALRTARRRNLDSPTNSIPGVQQGGYSSPLHSPTQQQAPDSPWNGVEVTDVSTPVPAVEPSHDVPAIPPRPKRKDTPEDAVVEPASTQKAPTSLSGKVNEFRRARKATVDAQTPPVRTQPEVRETSNVPPSPDRQIARSRFPQQSPELETREIVTSPANSFFTDLAYKKRDNQPEVRDTPPILQEDVSPESTQGELEMSRSPPTLSATAISAKNFKTPARRWPEVKTGTGVSPAGHSNKVSDNALPERAAKSNRKGRTPSSPLSNGEDGLEGVQRDEVMSGREDGSSEWREKGVLSESTKMLADDIFANSRDQPSTKDRTEAETPTVKIVRKPTRKATTESAFASEAVGKTGSESKIARDPFADENALTTEDGVEVTLNGARERHKISPDGRPDSGYGTNDDDGVAVDMPRTREKTGEKKSVGDNDSGIESGGTDNWWDESPRGADAQTVNNRFNNIGVVDRELNPKKKQKSKKQKKEERRAEEARKLMEVRNASRDSPFADPPEASKLPSVPSRRPASSNGFMTRATFIWKVIRHAPVTSLLLAGSTAGMIETGRQIGILATLKAADGGVSKRELTEGNSHFLQSLSRLADLGGEGTTGVFVLLNIWLLFGIPFLVCLAALAVKIAEMPKEARGYRALTRSLWGKVKGGGRGGKKAAGWITILPRQLFRCFRVAGEAITMGAQWRLPRGGWQTLGKVIVLLGLLAINGVLGYYAILVSSMASNDRGPNGSELGADTLEKISSTLSPSGGLLMLNIFMIFGVPVIAFLLYWFFKPNSTRSKTDTPLWKSILFFPRTVRRAIPNWLFNPIFVVVILVPYITVVLNTPWVLTQLFKLTGELSGRQVMLMANAFFLIMTPLMAMAVMEIEDVAMRIWRGFRGKS